MREDSILNELLQKTNNKRDILSVRHCRKEV